ncbi:LCP family protein [Lachnospiraceae bacterium ZAX-1]
MAKMVKTNKKRKVVMFAVEIMILLIVLLVLFVYLKLSKIDNHDSIQLKAEELEKNEDLSEETKVKLEEFTTIALFGLDNRSNGSFEQGNSDVIIIASINNETKQVKMVSVYRDTYLNMTDEGKQYSKANAAYNSGGPKQAISMLNVNLDLNIKEYVAVDFNALAEVVDLLGGIEVEVSGAETIYMIGYLDEIAEMTGKPCRYLPGAGTYNLDGVQATAFARVRQTTGDDFKRTERQRLVISKMVEKALASDLSTINKVADEMFGEISTSLSYTEILSLAKDAFGYSLGESTGFPQEWRPATMKLPNIKIPQECIIPADLAQNVVLLHKFLFDASEYKVTQSVQNISSEIVSLTGKTATAANENPK